MRALPFIIGIMLGVAFVFSIANYARIGQLEERVTAIEKHK